jgi:hypothetical protein
MKLPLIRLPPGGGRRPPKPPAGLTGASLTLWQDLQRAYNVVDEAGIALLGLAAQAHQRMLEAKAILDREGLFTGSPSKLRAHPAVVIEGDSRFAVVATLKQLGFDLEPVGKVGRPPGW